MTELILFIIVWFIAITMVLAIGLGTDKVMRMGYRK